jgi:hypothetical protein
MNTEPRLTCPHCGAAPLPSLTHPHGCTETGYRSFQNTPFTRAAARYGVLKGIVMLMGVLGEGGEYEVPLDKHPQNMEDAIAYAKWACVDWTRVVVRVDGQCAGIAKVPDNQRGEPKGEWFEGVGEQLS